MIAWFFGKTGHVATVLLDNQQTVNATWYVNHCIPHVIDAWQSKHPRSELQRLFWYHDNASAHTAAQTMDFFTQNSIQLVTHPPFSPDLAPCHFFLSPTVKEKLKRTKFGTPDDAVNAFGSTMLDLSHEQWANCFIAWVNRMKLCVQCDGDYFEKMWKFKPDIFSGF